MDNLNYNDINTIGNSPLVSVLIITYNHEKYIGQCIDEVLNQITNFSFEIIIEEDNSTDGTRKICEEYASKNKNKIRLFLQNDRSKVIYISGNPTGRYNFIHGMKQARGKYIALCDGDDYWSSPHKLQKQIDFLESNPDVVLSHSWHKYAVRHVDDEYIIKKAPIEGQGYYPHPIASVKNIFSNELRCKSRTMVFRNVIEEFPDWFNKVRFGDVGLCMLLGKFGFFGFIEEELAVYRQTGMGVSKIGKSEPNFVLKHNIEWIRLWEYGDQYYDYKYHHVVVKTIKHFIKDIYRRNEDKKSALWGLKRFYKNETIGQKGYLIKMKFWIYLYYLTIKKN